MSYTGTTLIKILGITCCAVISLGYGVFQARNLVLGPQIMVSHPQNGTNFTDPLITVDGTAYNITAISLNDRPIFIDETGAFSEKLLLTPGYTIMKVQAHDKFGRETQQLLELTYTPTLPPYNPIDLEQELDNATSSLSMQLSSY